MGREIPSLLLLLAAVSVSAARGGRGEFNSYFETPDLASPTLPEPVWLSPAGLYPIRQC